MLYPKNYDFIEKGPNQWRDEIANTMEKAMENHANLKELIPFLDDIMRTFYDEMLSHHHLSIFFTDTDHILRLIERQKVNFIESLDDSTEQLQNRFTDLGALHYTLRVPSSDFLKGSELWRQSFIRCVARTSSDISLVLSIEEYFDKIDNYLALGYLQKKLEADREDITALINRFQEEQELQMSDTLSHLQWLFQILEAVRHEDPDLAPELDEEKCLVHDVFKKLPVHIEPIFTREHFNDIHSRLHIDAKSLFYFLETKNYPEVLSLYSNLLSVYKITLLTVGNFNLAKSISSLRQNLSLADNEIKTLRGIIPICSYCKSVRNEEGVWDRLEKYILEHSDAKFSHGVCSKCFPKVKEQLDIEDI